MITHSIPSYYRKIKEILIMSPDWRYYQPTLSRTNIDGPKGVRVIEVRLYFRFGAF